jgi:soluble lytic murein transglycosylase-like protein
MPGVRAGSGVRPAARSSLLHRLVSPGQFAHYSMVRRLAARHSVEFRLVMAIIASESGGDPAAVSPAGAIGLMQLMPDTAAHLGVDPWDPEQNVEGAVRYLSSLLSTFGSVDLTLVAYNAGPGFAARYRLGQVDLGPETRSFLIRVGQLLQQ